jgi:hypothetical protein
MLEGYADRDNHALSRLPSRRRKPVKRTHTDEYDEG